MKRKSELINIDDILASIDSDALSNSRSENTVWDLEVDTVPQNIPTRKSSAVHWIGLVSVIVFVASFLL